MQKQYNAVNLLHNLSFVASYKECKNNINAVNLLHNLSFVASYKECKKYEVSAMMTGQPEVIDSFHQ